LSPRLEECILPDSLQPAAEADLIAEMFSAAEIKEIMHRYCHREREREPYAKTH
jgi:hypothetical protein